MQARRNVAIARSWLRIGLAIFFCATIGAVAAVFAMYASALGSIPIRHWDALIHVAVFFGLFGALLGTIMALDRSEPNPFPRWLVRTFHAPMLRTVLCSCIGTAMVAVVWSWHHDSFSRVWLIAGGVTGGILGWFGWRWAKYVDF
jgi:hypothetical protein